MARPLTNEEVRDQFLKHVVNLVAYWGSSDLGDQTTDERLSGLAFSILSAIDGSAMSLPGFILAPNPHPTDAEFAASEGLEVFFPETPEVHTDIAGGLHEHYHAVKDGTVKVKMVRRF